MIELNKIYNCDCRDLMQEIIRGGEQVDCIITDPPYGIGEDGLKNHSRGKLASTTKFTPKEWDKQRLSKEFFTLMRECSKNQIIFGGNYYADYLPPSSCWIVWDKLNGANDFADCELAWTSFKTAVRRIQYRWSGMLQGDMKHKEKRLHPCQKPLPVMEWIIEKYTNKDDIILDCFAGSCTTAVACHRLGRKFICCELDKEYYEIGVRRLEQEKNQINLFETLDE